MMSSADIGFKSPSPKLNNGHIKTVDPEKLSADVDAKTPGQDLNMDN